MGFDDFIITKCEFGPYGNILFNFTIDGIEIKIKSKERQSYTSLGLSPYCGLTLYGFRDSVYFIDFGFPYKYDKCKIWIENKIYEENIKKQIGYEITYIYDKINSIYPFKTNNYGRMDRIDFYKGNRFFKFIEITIKNTKNIIVKGDLSELVLSFDKINDTFSIISKKMDFDGDRRSRSTNIDVVISGFSGVERIEMEEVSKNMDDFVSYLNK